MQKEPSSQLSASLIGTVNINVTHFFRLKTILDLLPTQDAIVANKGLNHRDSRAWKIHVILMATGFPEWGSRSKCNDIQPDT